MSNSQPAPDSRDPGLSRSIAVIVVVVLATAAGYTVLALLWRGSLPDPVAIHYGPSGAADGFMSFGWQLVVSLALIVVLPAFLTISLYAGGRHTPAHRALTALTVGVTVFTGSLLVASLFGQRGLARADQATLGMETFGGCLAVAIVLAVAAYVVSPRATPPASVSKAEAPVLELGATERVSWRSAQFSPPFLTGGVAVLAVGVVLLFYGSQGAGIGTTVVAVVLMSTSTVSLRVDQRGARWRLGLIGRRIPLHTISRARVVDVVPTEYGGWGYRLSSRGVGIVLRGGPGITFERDDWMPITVTVPDVATGAAVTNGLLRR